MFLPFLPLIVVLTSLPLLAGLVGSSEPWLEMPIWIVLISILIFWILIDQLRQKNQIFNRAEPSSFSLRTNYLKKQLMQNKIHLKELKRVQELVLKQTQNTIGKDSNKWLANKVTSFNIHQRHLFRLNCYKTMKQITMMIVGTRAPANNNPGFTP